jgi:shikimate dehydrogenase
MSAPRPSLVVSLPARSAAVARRQIDAARAAGADLAEVRFDRWTPEELEHAADLFPSPLPLIATLRSIREGGEGPDEGSARSRILFGLSDLPFAYVDLEAGRDRALEEPIRARGRRTVRSSHLPQATPTREVEARLADGPPTEGMLKVVVPGTLTRAVREWVPRIEASDDSRTIFLATGAVGSLWRAWGERLRLPWIYAALPEGFPAESVEPSQVPVDRVVAFYSRPGAPIFAVVGHPVSHSQSPSLHHGWMREKGHVGLYVTLDLETTEEFRLAIEVLPGRGIRGLNVTSPWKRLAYECAQVRTDDARAAGVANCLTFRDDRLEVDNTDLRAIVRRLDELEASGRWDGGALTVLGGGGSARATLAAAQRRSCRATLMTRRSPESERLAREFGATAGDPIHPAPASLVVHATGVGRAASDVLELPLRPLLSSTSYLLDWVYSPENPVLSEVARGVGASYEDGRRLLVYQAAESYRQWWGEELDRPSIDASLRGMGCTA